MKYALISDIHGNLPAFSAILTDAKKHHIDKYLFLGDYIGELPWPNEIINTIRSLGSDAIVVRGNREDYIENLKTQNQSDWTYHQLAPLYWTFRTLTPKNLQYLISLPNQITTPAENNNTITLIHNSPIFFRRPKIEIFHTSGYRRITQTTPYTHQEYLQNARNAILNHPEAMQEIREMRKSPGVYAFGHNHLQWFMQFDGCNYVNPGSCGLPLAGDTAAPYTIIEQQETGWIVTECNVPYNVEEAVEGLLNSELYKQAEIWSKVMIHQLRTGNCYIDFFLLHAKTIAESQGQNAFPVSNDILQQAADTFEMIDLKTI